MAVYNTMSTLALPTWRSCYLHKRRAGDKSQAGLGQKETTVCFMDQADSATYLVPCRVTDFSWWADSFKMSGFFDAADLMDLMYFWMLGCFFCLTASVGDSPACPGGENIINICVVPEEGVWQPPAMTLQGIEPGSFCMRYISEHNSRCCC